MKKIINTFLKQKKQKQKGFTLLELLVVVALLSILLSISMFNYANFGRDVELENATYTTALAIREVQVYGINRSARKGTYSDAKDTFSDSNYRYGFYIKNGGTQLVLFKDKINDIEKMKGIYNTPSALCSVSDECYSEINLTRGNKIKDIKLNGASVADINISFLRPDPDATIITSSGDITKGESNVDIIISDETDTFFRCVRVGYAGDISIKRSC